MDPLITLFIGLRRRARGALPAVGIVLLAEAVLLDVAHPLDDGVFAVALGLLVLLLVARGWRRSAAVTPSIGLDVELGCLLGAIAFAIIVHIGGGLSGPLYPLVYVVVGVVTAFARPLASLIVIALLMGFEALLWWFGTGVVDLNAIVPHAVFATVFGMLNTLTLRVEIARLRRVSRVEREADEDRIRDEARSYRLLRAPLGKTSSSGTEEGGDITRLLRSGVEEIQQSVLLGLQLLCESMRIHTAVLLWLDEDEHRLGISELVSAEGDLEDGPFSARDGILGAVLTQRASLRFSDLKPSYVLPYYGEPRPIKAVCAVPVFEHGHLRGVLVVDRMEGDSFSATDQDLVEQAARFAARSIENERVFVQLERTKVEQGKLYRAAERLGAAITEQEVVDAGVSSAREIASVDFAAFTAFEEGRRHHQIRAVSGRGREDLAGETFADNAGLVSMALRNRHPLPYRGMYDPAQQTVFNKRLRPPDMPALVVMPLVVHDEPLGTLVLGSDTPGAFNEAARALLEVLASHMTVSLSHARMMRRLEAQATTDGLTGVLNKRALLDTAEQKLQAAKRFGRQLSVLVADIDHFKRVNDTYGHDVGDVVIRELANICERNKRTTDAVARFGGEEFVLVCEETDAEGAMLLAERIRADFSQTVFHAESKTLSCTCSVGIATFPLAGDSWSSLFKAADAALYVSKRSGRDRATIYDPSIAA